MTPEELDRKLEFIAESQARLAAAQEKDRQDRIEFEVWSKGLDARLAHLLDVQTDLLKHQSERIDRADKLFETISRQTADFRKGASAFQMEALRLLNQALQLLNLILDRLPPKPATP